MGETAGRMGRLRESSGTPAAPSALASCSAPEQAAAAAAALPSEQAACAGGEGRPCRRRECGSTAMAWDGAISTAPPPLPSRGSQRSQRPCISHTRASSKPARAKSPSTLDV